VSVPTRRVNGTGTIDDLRTTVGRRDGVVSVSVSVAVAVV